MLKTLMVYKGFKAQIMEAPRLVGDHVFELPKGTALPVYYVDEFFHPPENWMRGQGAFVVPVKPDKGLWFNWRDNDELNTAVLSTVKGCNPITGLKTSGFHLEEYKNKCPKHGCDFMADRFCPECDFKWPARNYQSMSPLWWDGFRADDCVRQFFFSEEELRDVATHMIGKNTVPAFGFTFFTPKEKREHPSGGYSRGMSGSIFTDTSSGMSLGLMDSYMAPNNINDVKIFHNSVVCAGGPMGASEPKCYGGENLVEEEHTNGIIVPESAPSLQDRLERHKEMKKKSFSKRSLRSAGLQVNSTPRPKKPVKEVSIGAGAKIRQALNADSYPLDSWKEVPDASMTIYFVFQEQFEEIKAKGMRDITGNPEGMLKNIPVG